MGLAPSPLFSTKEESAWGLGPMPHAPLLLTGQGPGPLYLHVRGAGSPLECTRPWGGVTGP